MISIDELDKTILELESRDTTFAVCEKLAMLYTVRDHIAPKPSFNTSRQSEFATCACGCDADSLMDILDEHFDALKLIYPKEYEAILQRIRSVI